MRDISDSEIIEVSGGLKAATLLELYAINAVLGPGAGFFFLLGYVDNR